MSDKKISQLTALTGANAATDDQLAIVDTNAAETKKISREEFFKNVPSLEVAGNTTLGDASTDTVRVNGYMGVGGAANSAVGLRVGYAFSSGTSLYGLAGAPTGPAGDTSFLIGVSGAPATNASAFTATNTIGLYAPNHTKGAGSTITNAHGVYIGDQTAATNNYGITSLVSSGANKWNIYASGTAANYFAGNVGIGTSSPGQKLHISGVSGDILGARFGVTASSQYLDIYRDGTSGFSVYNAGQAAPFRAHIWQLGGSEAMRIDSSGNVGIGTTTTGGATSNNTRVTGGIFTTVNGSGVSLSTGTATTIFSLTSTSASQIWLVSADLDGEAVSSYTCVSIVTFTNAGATSITALKTAATASLSVSGLNVQYTQSSGATKTNSRWSAIRIM